MTRGFFRYFLECVLIKDKIQMHLVVVESASKAKTIQTYLNRSERLKASGAGGTFKVMASMGHVMDLPPKKMGVETKGWEAEYVVTERGAETVRKLVGEARGAERIYLAADPDREGEAIAHHLKTVFERAGIPEGRMVRVAFHEITEEALVEAVLNPRAMDRDLIEAQEARRILDRVVGYEASPLLWRRFATTQLSAGRVQSAALKWIVERHQAFLEHTYEPYWTLEGQFELLGKLPVTARAVTPERWTDEGEIRKALAQLKKKGKWTVEMTQKMGTRRPPAPFTTSSLQQEAATKHGFSIESTMQIAQKLYEMGAITYMRTDSTTLSKTAQSQILKWIGDTYGEGMAQARTYKTKVANAQEAHEAIRPTDVGRRAADLEFAAAAKGAGGAEGMRKLYELIWRRTVASQMKEASVRVVTYRIGRSGLDIVFQGSEEVLTELGFLTVLQPEAKVEPRLLAGLDALMAGNGGTVEPIGFEFKGHVTRPEPLYQEASLVKQLEKKGIGRPSTFAPILKKLMQKGYVYKGAAPAHVETVSHYRMSVGTGSDIKTEEESLTIGGKETSALVPSSLGIRVVEYLDEALAKVVDANFTARMEQQLDDISRGELSKVEMLDTFYRSFHPDVERAMAIQKTFSDSAKKDKKAKEGTEANAELAPSNVLMPFESLGANVVQTRYGPALYITAQKAFVSVTPLLQWRKKTLEELTQTDVRFLMKLPLAVEGTGMEIWMGRYGLYVKNEGVSMKLNRGCWDAIYKNEWTPALIQENAVALAAPSGSRGSRTGGRGGGKGRTKKT